MGMKNLPSVSTPCVNNSHYLNTARINIDSNHSLRKTVGKVSPILVTLTSHNDSNFESSNVSLKENKPDGVNPNSNYIDYYVRKNEGKILWFSADWSERCSFQVKFSGPFWSWNSTIRTFITAILNPLRVSGWRSNKQLTQPEEPGKF